MVSHKVHYNLSMFVSIVHGRMVNIWICRSTIVITYGDIVAVSKYKANENTNVAVLTLDIYAYLLLNRLL